MWKKRRCLLSRKNMTPVKAAGNLRGSRMASVIGITNPMPSNANTAVLRYII